MAREPIEVTRQDRIYCLKASSDYHSEVCEKCRFYPNCDHMTQDDMTELTIKDLETLEQQPKTGHWIRQNDDYYDWYECSECGYGGEGEMQYSSEYDVRTNYCPNCGAKMAEI